MLVRSHRAVRSMRTLALTTAGLAAVCAGARTFGANASSRAVRATHAARASNDDARAVAALDTEFQRAVKNNDAATIDRILADDFVLVTGRGQAQDKEEQLREARSRSAVYTHQEDTNRRVRVWGNTAVVTALLWAQGTQDGKPFDYKLWFSDVYVRTPKGWKYVFGQAAQPLSKMERENTSTERQAPQRRTCTEYFSKMRSAVSSTRLSVFACTTKMRSKGSWCKKGSSATPSACRCATSRG